MSVVDKEENMRNTLNLLFVLIVCVSGCKKAPDKELVDKMVEEAKVFSTSTVTKEITLSEAKRLLSQERWEQVVAIGIPDTSTGFTISRHHEGTRVDLITDGNVYLIYNEYALSPQGKSFKNSGRISNLNSITQSVFRYKPYANRAKTNYIDIIGFAGDRMFKIHAWQNPNATESEREIAILVGRLAIETINSKLNSTPP